MAKSTGEPTILPILIYLVLAGVVALVLFITSFFVKASVDSKKKKERPAAERNERVGGQRRRGGADMMRRRVQTFEEEEESGEDEIGEDLPFDDGEATGKIGTKKLKKLEMKAEKRAMRQEIESEREEKKQRQKLLEEEAKRNEKLQQKLKENEEEEIKQQKEEQERLEHEEYLKLKESFSVEDQGSGEQDVQEESQSLLQEFIDYIKNSKVVLLEDLASHFSLRTQDAINRVQVLQDMGRLTGVVDDRGKFIYISQEELEAVAKFIKQRGRVSISDLSDSSNSLINLEAAIQRKKAVNQEVEASA